MKKKQILLTTGSSSSVNRSGGKLTIAGAEPIAERDILAVDIVPSTDEVAQVWTIGTSAPTVVAGATYTVTIALPTHEYNAGSKSLRKYSYVAPDTLSGNAVTDRTLLYADLAAKINADSTNFVTAVATAGTSLVLTDDAGYYPARPSGRGGASIVNLSGSFVESTHLVQTTAPVYAFGIGDDFVDNKPVYHKMTGNIISGEEGYPTNAVAGQKYDAYIITYAGWANHNAVAGMASRVENKLVVWVDNGKGTSTTNLANSRTFLNAMLPVVKVATGASRANIIEGFNAPCITSGSAVGTALAQNTIVGPGGSVFSYLPLVTSTITAPVSSTSGLQAVLDDTSGEGIEFTTSTTDTTAGFVAGTNAGSVKVIASIDVVAGLAEFAVGFRKQAAAVAAIDNYTDFAVLNAQAGTINIETALNNAATTTTDTTTDWADTEVHEFEVRVGIDRIAKFFVDGVEVTGVLSADFTFDSGDVLIPFVHALQSATTGIPVITSIYSTVK